MIKLKPKINKSELMLKMKAKGEQKAKNYYNKELFETAFMIGAKAMFNELEIKKVK